MARAALAEGLRGEEVEVEVEDAPDVVGDAAGGEQRLAVVLGEQRPHRHVERHDGQEPVRLEDREGGLGVVPDVGLGGGRHVAGRERGAAHDRHAADEAGQLGAEAERDREVGQRADGDDLDLAGTRLRAGDDLLGGADRRVARDVARVARVALAVVAVHVVGVAVRAADQRVRRAHRDGHVGQPGHRERVRGVARRGLDLDVAPDGARGHHLDRRVQGGVEDGNGVIDARVDVEDDRRRGHAYDPAGTSSRPSVSRTKAIDSRALCSAVLALTSSSMIARPS